MAKKKLEQMSGRISIKGVDMEVIERFKDFVMKKYGSLYGHFGKEIEWAMREYLEQDYDMHAHAHTHAHEKKAHEPKVEEVSSKDKVERRDIMYSSSGDKNNGGSETEKLPDPNEPGIPPSERTKRRILLHLKWNGMLDVETINKNAVKRVIGIEAGYDPRTINRYFNLLEDEYLLPHID